MLKLTTKKYAFFASCALLSLLLLILSGCDATSDPRMYYQATGSWEGTIDGKSVRGIIAPNGSYHLAVVDAQGAFTGAEYVGTVTIVDRDNNIGRMTLAYLRPPASAEILPTVSFKLTGSTLYSLDAPYNLTRTPDADGPGAQPDVAGRWSLSVNETTPDITNLVIDSDGNLSGNDGDACQYSGTLKLIDSAWNIFELNLNFSDYLGKDCKDDTSLTYEGLAMALPVENNRKHLWLASTVWTGSGTRTGTYIKNLAATINVAPVAAMTILGERADQSVLVQEGATVELDAQGSSDDNNDLLTYTWSGIAPDEITPLNIQGTGSAASFIPATAGLYTLTVTVDDGIASNALTRQLRVELTPYRFIGCGNGTVLDTRTNLLWLQDAGCLDLNFDVATNQWGLGAPAAQERVNSLDGSLSCGLSDGSVPGDWRLPKVEEFRQIVTATPFAAGPPALLNGQGTGQWIDGDVFVNVGATNILENKRYIYWTSEADLDPLAPSNWFFVNFNYDVPEKWSESQFEGTLNSIWPVRALRTYPTNPELNEQCNSAPVQ